MQFGTLFQMLGYEGLIFFMRRNLYVLLYSYNKV